MSRPAISTMILFLSLLARPAAAVPTGPFELGDFVGRFKGAVVYLSVENERGEPIGSGSGFFVAGSGRIVTNHHVIEHATRVTALLSDRTKVAVTGLLADDAKHDLAVLQVEGAGYPALLLGDDKTLQVGTPVVVISSPRGLDGTPSEGFVTAVREQGARRATDSDSEASEVAHWKIQHNADVSPGSSGSPLMTRDGAVVGVIVGLIDGERLNFAIPVSMAKALLDTIPQGAKPKALGPSVRRNLIISAVGFALLALVWGYFERAGRKAKRSGAAS